MSASTWFNTFNCIVLTRLILDFPIPFAYRLTVCLCQEQATNREDFCTVVFNFHWLDAEIVWMVWLKLTEHRRVYHMHTAHRTDQPTANKKTTRGTPHFLLLIHPLHVETFKHCHAVSSSALCYCGKDEGDVVFSDTQEWQATICRTNLLFFLFSFSPYSTQSSAPVMCIAFHQLLSVDAIASLCLFVQKCVYWH